MAGGWQPFFLPVASLKEAYDIAEALGQQPRWLPASMLPEGVQGYQVGDQWVCQRAGGQVMVRDFEKRKDLAHTGPDHHRQASTWTSEIRPPEEVFEAWQGRGKEVQKGEVIIGRFGGDEYIYVWMEGEARGRCLLVTPLTFPTNRKEVLCDPNITRSL